MRRDLGNRASPVNRAHMKRPLVSNGVMYRMNMASEITYDYTNIPAYVHQLNILQTQGTVKSPHSLFEERRH